jgi:gamma-glutamylcyclotransferase (GGCT)/AIG2-like uncharacterized protein YtfP
MAGMSGRCPGSTPVGTGYLQDWRLTFRGVADVEPSEGDVVLGALWHCPPEDVRSLDTYEGVAGGFYRRESLTIESEDGPVQALVYVMCPDDIDQRSIPSEYYYGVIADGYQDFNLPLHALEEALDNTLQRVVGKKGVTAFTPHGPKRLGPAGTVRRKRGSTKKKSKAKTKPKRVPAQLTLDVNDGPGQKSPATLALEKLERDEAERKRNDAYRRQRREQRTAASANAAALAILNSEKVPA